VKKNKSGEYIGTRTDLQSRNDAAFKEIAISQIQNSGENWAIHCLAVLKRNSLARLLYLTDTYRKILNVPGVIVEFGVQWGATTSTLINLRTLFEPNNTSRIIYGFNTFDGFVGSSTKDSATALDGDYKSIENYLETLKLILDYHESISPYPEIKKYQLIQGDVRSTLDIWLDDNPHAVISMAIFDMDIYEPTKFALERIKERLVKGSILIFDEFSCKQFPGETLAAAECLGLRNIRAVKHPLQNYVAIVEVE